MFTDGHIQVNLRQFFFIFNGLIYFSSGVVC